MTYYKKHEECEGTGWISADDYEAAMLGEDGLTGEKKPCDEGCRGTGYVEADPQPMLRSDIEEDMDIEQASDLADRFEIVLNTRKLADEAPKITAAIDRLTDVVLGHAEVVAAGYDEPHAIDQATRVLHALVDGQAQLRALEADDA